MKCIILYSTLLMVFFFTSCTNHQEILTTKQCAEVQDSVKQMADNIAKDLSARGPVAWLNWFENTPAFFMASDGKLAFANNDSATNFIKNILIKNIIKIRLKWSNLRVDPLTIKFANMAADFHEELTDNAGKTIEVNGYFTAITEQVIHGWQLRNAHWSLIH